MVCPNPHGDPALLAKIDKWRKPFANPVQLRFVLLIAVFANQKLFRVRVVARIDSDLVNPLGRFHGRVRFKMDIRNDRHITTALAQTFDDEFEIARILHRWSGDPHNFAADVGQLHCFLDRHLRVHRVARDHRLDANRVRPTNTGVTNHHLAS